jgi:hypothetical protein
VTLLPSASLDFLPPAGDEAQAKSAPGPSAEPAHRSRVVLVAGLALAAVLLAVGIVLIIVLRPSDSGGPTSVGAGRDSNEPPDEPGAVVKPTATQTAAASASAVAPRPVPPRPQPTRKKGFDPYDLDL